MVPREPTDEMLLAYRKAVETDLTTLFAESGAYRYKAMIAAAPKEGA